MRNHKLLRSDGGAAAIEMALALPILILFIWMMVQLGLVFRATSGIQHALGEGSRLATVWPAPTAADVKARVEESVYGIGPGEFTVPDPVPACAGACIEVTVEYEQETDMLLFPGPTIEVSRTKRVWTAGS